MSPLGVFSGSGRPKPKLLHVTVAFIAAARGGRMYAVRVLIQMRKWTFSFFVRDNLEYVLDFVCFLLLIAFFSDSPLNPTSPASRRVQNAHNCSIQSSPIELLPTDLRRWDLNIDVKLLKRRLDCRDPGSTSQTRSGTRLNERQRKEEIPRHAKILRIPKGLGHNA